MAQKNKINEKLYNFYLENPPKYFPCSNGNIYMYEYTVRNILVSIKHLTQELDAIILFVGREGSGKSLFMRQINYIYWYFLTKFGLIDYEFSLDLVHFGIKELQRDRLHFDLEVNKKYRISNLDESKDDLGRDKHNDPKTQEFLNYIRRCRDESGVITLAQPQISEFLPSIVLSRALFIFEVDYDLDDETGDIIRGEYKLITIPRGKKSYSPIQKKSIPRNDIKVTLGEYVHNPKLRYADIPKTIVSYQGKFNGVDPCNTKEYLDKKQKKKWERIFRDEEELSELKKEVKKLRNIKEYFHKLLLLCKSNKITNKVLANALKLSSRTVDRYISEAKEE